MTIAATYKTVIKSTRKPRRSIAELLAPLEQIAATSPNLVANHDARFEVDGEEYVLPRYLFVGPRGGDVPIRVGIFAGIHGDEPEGVHALIQFIKLLEAKPELATGYYLSFYPVCNPTGFEDNTRHSRVGKELFDYLNFGEGVERAKLFQKNFKEKTARTFLNVDGEYWSEKGLNNAYRKLWVREEKPPILSFRVTPHMLRHTFATFELYSESKRTNIGNALAWVRDRLGHRSIATTTVYVHCLDLMEESELNIYQKELDDMMGNR